MSNQAWLLPYRTPKPETSHYSTHQVKTLMWEPCLTLFPAWKRVYESRGASGYVQKKGRRTTDRETEAQALMWKWVLLRSKLLPGTPGLQFYLGDEAGALASPHLDREQQPCAGKRLLLLNQSKPMPKSTRLGPEEVPGKPSSPPDA